MHSGHIEGNDLHKRKANLIKSLFFQEGDNLPINLVKGEESDLEKGAGEGSRGGHVIGHTKNGKPIYGGTLHGRSEDAHLPVNTTPHPLDAHMASQGFERKGSSHGSQYGGSNVHGFVSKQGSDHSALVHINEHENGKLSPFSGNKQESHTPEVQKMADDAVNHAIGQVHKERGIED